MISQPAFLITCLLSFPFSFDVASHKSLDSFFISFFYTLIFSFFKDYNKKSQRFHMFFLSSFLSFISSFFEHYVYRYTDVHTEHYTCILYYQEILCVPVQCKFLIDNKVFEIYIGDGVCLRD